MNRLALFHAALLPMVLIVPPQCIVSHSLFGLFLVNVLLFAPHTHTNTHAMRLHSHFCVVHVAYMHTHTHTHTMNWNEIVAVVVIGFPWEKYNEQMQAAGFWFLKAYTCSLHVPLRSFGEVEGKPNLENTIYSIFGVKLFHSIVWLLVVVLSKTANYMFIASCFGHSSRDGESESVAMVTASANICRLNSLSIISPPSPLSVRSVWLHVIIVLSSLGFPPPRLQIVAAYGFHSV